ncbi:MAG: hypothetical protein A2V67_20475 [Deltaproteobacteria bacterium RBG_13_61_14]|nr:MAG: hypothetical protein A2V67_20475 [Deltaproteobacteria bacterium RBG_13_61_14]
MIQEVRSLVSGGLVSCQVCPERRSRYAQWICVNCREVTEEKLSPDTLRLLLLRQLLRAGYPFEKNDLDAEDWLNLGQIEELIEEMRRQRLWH